VIDLEQAAAAIGAGLVVVIPTDTVYGLACDPASAEAVERVYAVKGRPPQLELGLLAADVAQLKGLVEFGEAAHSLATAFWPGALSLVCPVGPRRLAVPRHGSSLMVRVAAHRLLRSLLEVTGPVASTSANRHGRAPAATAEEALELAGDTAGVLDGGPSTAIASTIIDLTSSPPRILRGGPIPEAALRPHLDR
jgi:tRNA threonylcarbamoyl adenosine modification protein (Sua5/YciO/YrdC/YwlC family)